MTANILDGKLVSSLIRNSLKQRINQLSLEGLRPPCLAVVLLGNDHASSVYVNHKRKACAEVGIRSIPHILSAQTSEKELLYLIAELNASPDVDGILVQLPLPPHIRASTIIESIHPQKDVDGFHPLNMGRLAQGHPQLRPCTPLGVMRLLQHYQLSVSGLSAVVIGSSTIVGRPMALELLLAKATVTIAHRKTRNLEQHIRQADLVVTATGVPDLIDIHWLHKNQIIIDVGIHRTLDNKLRGDIDFTKAQSEVAWITPVPGGVGPMTVTMLLENTIDCWTEAHKSYLSRLSQSNSSSNSPS
ncbi:MAG: bifunctional methylenetetrahydrofolate dehydrogenase/methenyltetrahydrofolate cyclohydrolase FolD [Gammaproteobacteria bacterium]|nr:bifunctional methylenetetrahydrofolate dehydrogenase/methenyltetrahydrofolate cyclohydrolase FolD [Gammaproteobacteria bacterium]